MKNKATSITIIYKVFEKIALVSKVGNYFRDGNFATKFGILNLHPSKGTHWVCYSKVCYFDSYGCSPPKTFSITKKDKQGNFVCAECQIQKMIVSVLVMF